MIRKRERRLAMIAVAAVLAGVLPAALTLTVTYRQSVTEAGLRLDRYANVLETHAEEIFGAAEASLQAIEDRIDRHCSQASFELLRKTVYNSLYFREAGLIYDGALQCNSQQLLDPPLPIRNPDLLVWPLNSIHIAAPDLNEENEVSIVVLHGVDGTARGKVAVQLMLNPRQLLEPVRAAIDEQQIAMRIERSDGTVLARAGSLLVSDDERDSIVRSRSVAHYPLRVIVAGARDSLLERWWQNAWLFVLIGLGISLPLFLMLAWLDRRERSLEAQLSDALDNDELEVYYQPIHQTKGLQVVGAEALLRWNHPQRGLIMPGVFVPLAEANGLINPMTDWLMKRVAQDLESALAGHPHFYVTVNLSPAHFNDASLPATVHRIFGVSHTAGRLVFEVTEREMLSTSDDIARMVIDQLRIDGARVALDDFGTGYSSLRYLAQFRFDMLKIDKSFIDSIGTESVTAGLVEDIVAMARRLQLGTVAEGVETMDQLDYLRELGVDYVQGWCLSKALPLDALLRYLAKP